MKLRPEFDHRPPLAAGGENRESKIEAVCGQCHLSRTRTDATSLARTNRAIDKRLGIKRAPTRNPVPGSRRSPWEMYWCREQGRWRVRRRERET